MAHRPEECNIEIQSRKLLHKIGKEFKKKEYSMKKSCLHSRELGHAHHKNNLEYSSLHHSSLRGLEFMSDDLLDKNNYGL